MDEPVDRSGRVITARALQLELARVAALARMAGEVELLDGLRGSIAPLRERANAEVTA